MTALDQLLARDRVLRLALVGDAITNLEDAWLRFTDSDGGHASDDVRRKAEEYAQRLWVLRTELEFLLAVELQGQVA